MNESGWPIHWANFSNGIRVRRWQRYINIENIRKSEDKSFNKNNHPDINMALNQGSKFIGQPPTPLHMAGIVSSLRCTEELSKRHKGRIRNRTPGDYIRRLTRRNCPREVPRAQSPESAVGSASVTRAVWRNEPFN